MIKPAVEVQGFFATIPAGETDYELGRLRCSEDEKITILELCGLYQYESAFHGYYIGKEIDTWDAGTWPSVDSRVWKQLEMDPGKDYVLKVDNLDPAQDSETGILLIILREERI